MDLMGFQALNPSHPITVVVYSPVHHKDGLKPWTTSPTFTMVVYRPGPQAIHVLPLIVLQIKGLSALNTSLPCALLDRSGPPS